MCASQKHLIHWPKASTPRHIGSANFMEGFAEKPWLFCKRRQEVQLHPRRLPWFVAADKTGRFAQCDVDHLYSFGYNQVMNVFHRTSVFDEWLQELKDKVGKALILKRIRSAEAGNFSDCKSVG
jgi:hypothetical protein